jgi:hypothetical protein
MSRTTIIAAAVASGLLSLPLQAAELSKMIPNSVVIESDLTQRVETLATANAKQSEIEKQLKILSQWADYKSFQAFLLWLPTRWDMYDAAKSTLNFSVTNSKAAPNTAEVALLEKLGPKGMVIAHLENNLASPSNALTTQPPGAPNADPSQYNNNFAIFFRLPCINADVPEPVFESSVAAFINGFVTRTVLADFEDAMLKANPRKNPIPDLASPSTTFPPNPRSPFEDIAWENNVGFDTIVTRVLTKTPIQGDATLCGWYAAQQLAHADQAYRDAAKALLKMRLDTRRVGQIVGYTLSYLSGYSANQIEKKAATDAAGSQGILDHLGALAKSGAENVGRVNPANTFGQLNNALYTAVIAGFAQSTSSTSAAAQSKSFHSFLLGFNQGTVRAAEVVYADTYLLAYGIGYADGFRDGYSKGYAEGYRAGYAAGWAAAPRSFFTGLDSFLGDLGDVLGTVVDVIGVVGSLFG